MKISRLDVTHIYQEQLRKIKSQTDGEFSKIIENSKVGQNQATKASNTNPNISNASKISNLQNNPIEIKKSEKANEAELLDTFRLAAEIVAKQPDIRAEKVERIKKLIESGQYNIPPQKVAEKLLATKILTEPWEG